MKKEAVFRGTATAIITPFRDDKIDYAAYGAILENQIACGVDAIVVCGTTGEAATLDDREHREIVEYTVEKVAHRVPVIAGTGSNDCAYAIELSRHACAAGADALLHVTPYYNKTSQRGLVRHFEKIADACDKPVILYNVPSRTGMGISLETYRELVKHPNIVATKEASGNLSFITELLVCCGDELYVYSGNDDQTIPLMAVGASGLISVLSNVMPAEVSRMTRRFLEGDWKGSAAEQLRLIEIMNAMFMTVNPIPVKTAMAMLGACSPEMRLPLAEMSEAENEKLASVLRKYGLLPKTEEKK